MIIMRRSSSNMDTLVLFTSTVLLLFSLGNAEPLTEDKRYSKNEKQERRRLRKPIHGIESEINDESSPHILWLLNYPDSGGSFTINAIQEATGFTAATNYGTVFVNTENGEHVVDTYESIPLFSHRPNGPFLFSDLPIPEKFIMTKTHCGGHCTDCDPNNTVMQHDQFWMQCANSFKLMKEEDGHISHVHTEYNHRIPKKLLHLMRNPFDNVISRFHHEYKHRASISDFEFTNDFPYSPAGFQKWCSYLDEKYSESIVENHIYDNPITQSANYREIFLTVPCHSEFFKYINWHNQVSHLIRNPDKMGNLPSLVIRYEDYLHSFPEAMAAILHLLELPEVNKPEKFVFQRYEYFTEAQKKAATEFMKYFVIDEAKKDLEPYLGPYES